MDNIFVERLWRIATYEEVYLKARDGAAWPVDKWKAAARLPTSPRAPQPHQTKTDSKEGKMVIPSSRTPRLQTGEDRIQAGGCQL